MRRARWAVCAAALALTSCGGPKHYPLQPMAQTDQGRFYIRSVTVVSNESEADFDSAFRRRLNESANTDQPSGKPVDLYVTVKDFEDATLAAEILMGQRSAASAEFALRDADNRNRPIYRDTWSVQSGATGVNANVNNSVWSLAFSLAATAVANAVTNEAEEMAEDLADFLAEEVIDTGQVMLPQQAAFALPPRAGDGGRTRPARAETAALTVALPPADPQSGFVDDGLGEQPYAERGFDAGGAAGDRFIDDGFIDASGGEAAADDAFFDDPAYALPDEPEPQDDPSVIAAAAAPTRSAAPIEIAAAPPPRDVGAVAPPAATAGLPLGVYDSEGDAEDEAASIARFSGDVAPASALTITQNASGYLLTAVGLRPSAERMLCARRKIEDKPCG